MLPALGIAYGGDAAGVVHRLTQVDLQLAEVGGRIHRGVRDVAQHRHVVQALMRFAVIRDDAGTVDGQHDVPVHDRGVIEQLIERALQKRRVHGEHRDQSPARQAGGEGDGVLLGDADVEKAGGEPPREAVEARALLHGGGDRDDAVVLLAQTAHQLAEAGGERLAPGCGLARFGREAADAVIHIRAFFRLRIALALDRGHMQQHRAADAARRQQCLRQIGQIVAVHRPHVVKAHVLEKRGVGEHRALDALFHVVDEGVDRLADQRDMRQKVRQPLLPVHVAHAGAQMGQIAGDEAHVLADAHLIVVEDHDQPVIAASGVAQPLVGQTAGQCAVADHRDGVAVVPRQRLGLGDAVGRGDRGAAVSGDECVVLAFRRLGKAGDAAAFAQGREPVVPAGEQLMCIALVSDVPHDRIVRGGEHTVQRHGQLHRAEIGGQVSPVLRHGSDHRFAQGAAKLRQLFLIQFFHIVR